jgi:hypothetical protein
MVCLQRRHGGLPCPRGQAPTKRSPSSAVAALLGFESQHHRHSKCQARYFLRPGSSSWLRVLPDASSRDQRRVPVFLPAAPSKRPRSQPHSPHLFAHRYPARETICRSYTSHIKIPQDMSDCPRIWKTSFLCRPHIFHRILGAVHCEGERRCQRRKRS